MAKKNRTKKTKEEAIAYLDEWLVKYAQDERVLKMKDSPHHPPISAYTHCVRVVRKAVDVVNFFHMKVDWDALLMAALLHDFYLYDFREMNSFRNCLVHPKKAAENAKTLFDANDHITKAIRSHMFPITFWTIPTSREAWVVSFADKLVGTKEMLAKK